MRRHKVLLGIAAGGVVAGLAVTQGTAALWQTSGAGPDVKVTTGALGLTVTGADDEDADPQHPWSGLTATNMKPGDSVGPGNLVVRNAGNIPLQYHASFDAPDGLPLNLSLAVDGTPGAISTWRQLGPGDYDVWSVTITLPTNAPNSAQGQPAGEHGAPAELVFTGEQVKHNAK